MPIPLVVDDTRLPKQIESGAAWLLTTETYISTSPGGVEQRQAKREPRWEGTISVGPEYVEIVRDMFYSQVGPRWAFKAWCTAFDFLDASPLTIDTNNNWPIVANLGPGTRIRSKRILLPEADTLAVYVDGIENTSYTLVDDANGLPNIISFGGSVSGSAIVEVTGYFLLPFRFAEDNLPITSMALQNDGSVLQTVQQARIIEVIG